MADDFKAGDRVRMRNGELGEIMHVDGGLAQIRLDSSLCKRVATAALRKIDGNKDSSGASGSATHSQNVTRKTMLTIRVLLVEDDAAFARLIEAALATSKIEFDVHVVDHLAAAVAALDEQGFNLVLLDLNLPDSSGLQTLEAVVAAARVPIIVLMGRDDEDIADKLKALGAECLLSKAELNTSSLIESMRQAVSLHRKANPQERALPSVEEVFGELTESVTSIEVALEVFELRRLDPVEDIAIRSAKTHVRKMKTVIAKYRGG